MSGRFVELEHAWHETNVVHCGVCGTLIPRRAWVFDGGEGEAAAPTDEEPPPTVH